MYAAGKGHLDVARVLLEGGADKNLIPTASEYFLPKLICW